MEAKAVSKYLRISPFKARQVTRLIQGKPASEAKEMLGLMPRKAAKLIAKTLGSAIANAENNSADAVDLKTLRIKEAVIGEGPTIKRFRPKARGMAGRICKRTSHIRVVVTDE